MKATNNYDNDQDLVITRTFDAPRDLLFSAWTEPERLMQWWRPKGFATPYCSIDLRQGGTSLCCMRSPEGKDYWSKGVYQEIVVPELLIYSDSFADPEGNVVPASYYGMTGDWPSELLVTVTFEEDGGQTNLTLRHTGIPVGENLEGARQGWNESFDRLADYLAEETGEIRNAA